MAEAGLLALGPAGSLETLRGQLRHNVIRNTYALLSEARLIEMRESDRYRELDSGIPEFCARLKDAYDPAGAVDELSAFDAFDSQTRTLLRERLHALFLNNFRPDERRRAIADAFAAFLNARQAWENAVDQGGGRQSAVSAERHKLLHKTLSALDEALGSVPRWRWVP